MVGIHALFFVGGMLTAPKTNAILGPKMICLEKGKVGPFKHGQFLVSMYIYVRFLRCSPPPESYHEPSGNWLFVASEVFFLCCSIHF